MSGADALAPCFGRPRACNHTVALMIRDPSFDPRTLPARCLAQANSA